MSETVKVRSACFECHSRCGVFLLVRDGRIEGIEGDRDHPISRGFICPKARAVKEIVYHPDRLKYPLQRVGDRGDKKWQRISWDEALDTISGRLANIKEKAGPEAVVMGHGTSRGLNPYLTYFLACFGSPNRMSSMHLSGGPVIMGNVITCGLLLLGGADFENTRCLMVWGHNPPHAWPGHMPGINQALKRGAKLVVIDPRRSEMAGRADIWLRVRPGTDCALALSILNVMITEKLYDKEFVERWTVGFERLAEHVKTYSPEKMADITWVPANLVRDAARMYATEGPSYVGFGVAGLCQHINAVQTNRAISMLIALSGNLGAPGGNVHYTSPLRHRSQYAMELYENLGLAPEQVAKRLGADRFKMTNDTGVTFAHPSSVWDAILNKRPYAVKALLLFGNNAVVAFSNSALTRKALLAVDFLVAADYFMNPTAELADLVLPAAHWTERDDVEDVFLRNYAVAQQKAIEPEGECWDDKKILVELAKRLGLKRYWKSVAEALDYRVEPAGLTFDEFKRIGFLKAEVKYKRYEQFGGFRTPTGKVELYSETLARLGYDPMPVPHEPPESPVSTPELAREYPLVMTTGARLIAYYHSGLRNIPSLRKLAPDPTIEMHPDTAKNLGIKEGEWVRVETPRGSIKRKLKLFDGIDPRVVHMAHGWWYSYEPEWRAVNVNILTDNSRLDPMIGSEPLRGLLCRVLPLKND